MKAVSLFPGFCAEHNSNSSLSSTEVCTLQILTLATHIIADTSAAVTDASANPLTQGLTKLWEAGCPEADKCKKYSGNDKNCKAAEGKLYYPRVASWLKTPTQYCWLSEILYGNKEVLRLDPDLVLRDSVLFWVVYLTKYMHTFPQKPSIYDVVNGNWQPNEKDQSRQLLSNFGMTTLLWTDNEECGKSIEENRVTIFESLATAWNIDISTFEAGYCGGSDYKFEGGAADLNIYFNRDTKADTIECVLTNRKSDFPVTLDNAYLLCIKDARQKEKERIAEEKRIEEEKNKPRPGVDQSAIFTLDDQNMIQPVDSGLQGIIDSTRPEDTCTEINLNDLSNAPANVKRFISVFSEENFNTIFPNKPSTGYTYQDFVNEFSCWSAFCGESGDVDPVQTAEQKEQTLKDTCLKEALAFFANVVLVTGKDLHNDDGWKSGLQNFSDPACSESGSCKQHNKASKMAPILNPSKRYFGRGILSMTKNGVYARASLELEGSRHVYLDTPELLATDP
ncbi:MAG: glycoside hydrolase family 19 protein, partial [Bacteroidota bacterium]